MREREDERENERKGVTMNIEGTYTLQASLKDVWNCMMDQQALQIAVPGVERIEVAGADTFTIALRVSLTPLMDISHGRITVSERHYPTFYRLKIEGEGDQHTINGEGSVFLSEHGENTVVAYEGTLHLSESRTPLPLPVVKGAAKLLVQQFFTSLSDQLNTTESVSAVTLRPDHGKIVLLPVLPQQTMLGKMVRRLGLGAGDPVAEEQWANRIKLGAIVLGLLLLVWVGSRIPRRKEDDPVPLPGQQLPYTNGASNRVW